MYFIITLWIYQWYLHVKLLTLWISNCSPLAIISAILNRESDNNLAQICHPAMNLFSGTWRRFGIISPIIQMSNSKWETLFIPLLAWCWVSVTSFQGFPFGITHPNYKIKIDVFIFACSIFIKGIGIMLLFLNYSTENIFITSVEMVGGCCSR